MWRVMSRYDPLVQHLADLKEKRALVLQTLNSCMAEEKKVGLLAPSSSLALFDLARILVLVLSAQLTHAIFLSHIDHG